MHSDQYGPAGDAGPEWLIRMTFHAIESFPFGDITISSVSSPSLEKELVVQRMEFEATLPEGMAVDFVAAYRIAFVLDFAIHKFSFDIAFSRCESKGNPNSGECLDAQSWAVGRGIVMIGTEDGESLQARMPWLPIRDDDYPVTYLGNGFRVEIAKVAPKTPVGFHFVLAYNHIDTGTGSEWFAVDVPHSKLSELPVAKHLFGATDASRRERRT